MPRHWVPPRKYQNWSAAECSLTQVLAAFPLGKVKLIVSPLVQKRTIYTGDYQLKVTPYFFKSQKGGLVLVSSGDLVAKLSQGKAVEFTGKATNIADGTSKFVRGKATPSTPDQGAVTFSILTDNGEMVFNTFYHFGT